MRIRSSWKKVVMSVGESFLPEEVGVVKLGVKSVAGVDVQLKSGSQATSVCFGIQRVAWHSFRHAYRSGKI